MVVLKECCDVRDYFIRCAQEMFVGCNDWKQNPGYPAQFPPVGGALFQVHRTPEW